MVRTILESSSSRLEWEGLARGEVHGGRGPGLLVCVG